MDICFSKLTIIGSDNGLSPGRHQAIIWTNAEILLTGSLEINFSEILITIHIFSFTKMPFKMSSGNWRPFQRAILSKYNVRDLGWVLPCLFFRSVIFPVSLSKLFFIYIISRSYLTYVPTAYLKWKTPIEAHWGRDKWPPFSIYHFQMHFREWKCINFDQYFTVVCSQGSNQQDPSIVSDNGLAPSRLQAIIRTNVV